MKKRRLTKSMKDLVLILLRENYEIEDIAHYLFLDSKKVKEFLKNEY